MEDFIKEITIKAGDAVLEKFGKVGVKYSKAHVSDVVTEADLISNKILIDSIKRKYPDHGIVTEETNDYQRDKEYVWIIDPLDGTRNFATGMPLFGVIVGLAQNSEMKMGAIYLPYQDMLVFAEKSKGAYLNNQKINCSQTKEMAHSYGFSGASLMGLNRTYLEKINNFAKKDPVWVNTLGSLAVGAVYLASGKRDWYCSGGGSVWDYAGPSLILSEAGCIVSDISGSPWKIGGGKGMIAANKYLHPKLMEIIQNG